MMRFTVNPLEALMQQRNSTNVASGDQRQLPRDHPCFGCGFTKQPCVGLCLREQVEYLQQHGKNSRK